MEVSGSLLASYLVCKRQAWLVNHAIEGDVENDYLRQGTYIHEQGYKRQQTKAQFGSNQIDITKNKGGKLVVGEVKKSSHCLQSARLQLVYYLYQLKEEGVEAIVLKTLAHTT